MQSKIYFMVRKWSSINSYMLLQYINLEGDGMCAIEDEIKNIYDLITTKIGTKFF